LGGDLKMKKFENLKMRKWEDGHWEDEKMRK
jgi:hypothetical protein